MTELSKKSITLIKRAKRLADRLEKNKELYKKQEKVIGQILELNLEGVVKIDDYQMTVKDNFAEKNSAFRPAAFKRFELKFEEIKHG
tara:strand:- start:3178 stop:3438 length:261 start_codon:yes stop_codon:yes gene_type:complete